VLVHLLRSAARRNGQEERGREMNERTVGEPLIRAALGLAALRRIVTGLPVVMVSFRC